MRVLGCRTAAPGGSFLSYMRRLHSGKDKHKGNDLQNSDRATSQSSGDRELHTTLRVGAAFANESMKNLGKSDMPRNPASVYAHDKDTEKLRVNPGVSTSCVSNGHSQSAATNTSISKFRPVHAASTRPIQLRTPPQRDVEKAAAQAGVRAETMHTAVDTTARPGDGPTVPDYGPLRATGLWSVEDVVDDEKKRVDFRRIDDIESEIMEEANNTDEALVPYDEEERWKHKLMFVHKFAKTPKHLTWKELGEEIECMDCVIDLDEHRPEEMFTITFYFTDKKTGTRDIVWSARNDVAYSEGFTDLLAAIGACLGRSDVHRTIRFDDGQGNIRDISLRKRSRYTSDVVLAFRPGEKYDKFKRKQELDEYEESMEAQGMSTWGFHAALMDPEYNQLDFEDPEGTYEVAMSAHGFCYIFLKAVNRLLSRPMKEFYRQSQLMRTAKVRTEDEVGLSHALKGWMGVDEQIYPHYTPLEAIQTHWLGPDAPFSLTAIVNKLREMTYLKKENPEFHSWLGVRYHDTHLALRNVRIKLLGVGASSLFLPVAHDSTVNRLLPKHQQRRLESGVSLNALLGLPDETRRIDEFKRITGLERLSGGDTTPPAPFTTKGDGVEPTDSSLGNAGRNEHR